MKYMIITKDEWEDSVTNLGTVYDDKEEAVQHGLEEWGGRSNDLLLVEISGVQEVVCKVEYNEYKGDVK
jgi:hypothetical protein